MAEKPKIVGYGICGPNEPYLENTLAEFARLCDETIICLNNSNHKELVESYGFKTVVDNTEWGKNQWKIKEDFLTNHVSKLEPDLCVCLDMDEVFDKNLTKEGLYDLYKSEFSSFYFYIVNLWDEGYQKELCFWNIRAFKWNGDTKFKRKNLHCGLAPELAYYSGFYSPYIVKHYGLKDAKKRAEKVKRYEKYDPDAKWLSLQDGYYKTLSSYPQVSDFDEDKLHQEVVDYVQTYKQKLVKPRMENKEDLIIIKTLAGEEAVVPRKMQKSYEKQGCEIVGDYGEVEKTLSQVLEEEPVEPSSSGGFEDAGNVLAEPEPTEVFKCGDCGSEFDSGRKLNAHKIGKHKKSFKWGK